MSHHDELPSIDPSALDEVTGGVTSTSSTGSGSNAQLTAMLGSISSSIQGLASNNSSSLQSLLPMMLMMGRGGASGGSAVAAGGACPCGCGMANCMRR